MKRPIIYLKLIGITLTILLCFSRTGVGQCVGYDLVGIPNIQDSLAMFFPNICKKVVLGKSVLGRDIVALKISDNVQNDETEPEVLLTACLHGDEGYPEVLTVNMARTLCLQYNIDPEITKFVNTREIWIISVANPDGQFGHSYGSRSNANGVDINRDFGYMWNMEDFDLKPFQEIEARLIRDFLLERNINVMIDFHSGLQGIIYPWYYREEQCPDDIEIRYLANQYDLLSGYPPGEFAVTSGYDLYATNGSLVEFAYGSLGIYAYTVELVNANQPIELCEVMERNAPSIYNMFSKAGEGITGLVTDAESGQPIQARILIGDRVPSYSSLSNGDYHRFLRAGNYTITASANGYNDLTYEVSVIDGDITLQNFELTSSDNYAAAKVLSCRNYNNYTDPAITWNVLGQEDNQIYAIGDSGYIVIDMGFYIADLAGNDLTVYGEASSTDNAYELFVAESIDAPWISIGTATGTQSFDISGNTNIRYLRIEDNGSGVGNIFGAGFKIDAITATKLTTRLTEIDPYLSAIHVYPNPIEDVVRITNNDASEIEKIRIFDVNGRLMLQCAYKNKIDIHDFMPGIYFVQFYGNSKVFSTKIIKS